jgi:hypothetical protein
MPSAADFYATAPAPSANAANPTSICLLNAVSLFFE